MSAANIVVLKFGSSVLRSECDLPQVVHEIYRLWRRGERVAVVVSALGDATDQLLARATSIWAEPDEGVLATLLATGQTTASALLALALQRAGILIKVFDAAQAGLRTPSRQGVRQVVDEIVRHGTAKAGCQVKAGRGRHARNPRAKLAVIPDRHRTGAKRLRNDVEKVA